MNYRHAYHAGNFADVMKHVMLIALMDALAKKDKPFCVLDTHAGAGIYDLSGEQARRSREHEKGITRALVATKPPAEVKRYFDCIAALNAGSEQVRLYPGSPQIAADHLRPTDRLVVCELQRDAYASLSQIFHGNKQVGVHHTDGYLGLKAFLPPAEKRGLILIDPPYEASDEFARIVREIQPAFDRFPTGVYAIWYPMKDKAVVDRFYRSIRHHIKQPILRVELSIYADVPDHLTGSGLAIINPPYQFELKARPLLAWLWKALSINEEGSFRAQFLK